MSKNPLLDCVTRGDSLELSRYFREHSNVKRAHIEAALITAVQDRKPIIVQTIARAHYNITREFYNVLLQAFPEKGHITLFNAVQGLSVEDRTKTSARRHPPPPLFDDRDLWNEQELFSMYDL